MNALEMALEALTNPSTIAVQHAIELIRAELAKPEQKPTAQSEQKLTEEGKAWGEMAKKMSRDFMESANKNWESPPKNVGTITIGELRKTDLYRRMATQSLREAFTPPRKEWVDLTANGFRELLKMTVQGVDENKLTEAEGIWLFGSLVQVKLKELNA